MKKEIVYTDRYALILSDEEAHIDDKNVYLDLKKGIYRNLLAHLPLSDAPILEGVPLLPSFSWSQQDDVENLAKEEYPIFDGDLLGIANNQQHSRVDFIKGYNKAKEKYKYTEDDLKLAMNYGYVQGDTGFQGVANLDDLLDLIHIKIKKSSRPTHFECETTPMNLDEIREQGKGFLNANIYKIKTTTNSQGQEELVGKYLNL